LSTHAGNELTTCKVVAPSCLKALRLLREKLGPDAFVLSSMVTVEGVEIVASLEDPGTGLLAPGSGLAFRNQVRTAPAITASPFLGSEHDEQLLGLRWNTVRERDPLRGQLLRTLLGAGFSARLAKDLLADLPTGQNHTSGLDHIKSAMAHRIPMLGDEEALMDEGGVYALMGPTGVGKTTTTAKLAARCVMRFGPEKLALVTTDSYRIGAYEQLRIYGQILGVEVHAVRDAGDLDLVLEGLRRKHLVLIDTVGMSQRDRAVSAQISMLCGASRPVKRLLLLNAASHGDTLNEVVQAYRHGDGVANANDLAGCILTKVDEATHPGAVIDIVIRHQLPIHYISSGQKVPEHLMLGDRTALIDSVFQANSGSSFFVLGEADLDERPAAPGNEEKVLAVNALNDGLRSQCRQLIRTLSHTPGELTSTAAALAAGQIGFEESRLLWRRLSGDQAAEEAMTQTLRARAGAESKVNSIQYVLATSGEVSLPSLNSSDARVCITALLSDRTGLPFAATQEFLPDPEDPGKAPLGGLPQSKCAKPVVHLLARLPSSDRAQEWQSGGLRWLAGAPCSLGILVAESGTAMTLEKLARTLSFSVPQASMFRGKPALLSVAEVGIRLRPDPQAGSAETTAGGATLRCIVSRVTDAGSGKPLSHSYVLASTSVEASAQEIVQWAAWRAAAKPYFKLLDQGLAQLCDSRATDEVFVPQRVLLAAQVSITVFLLQQARGAWAETARTMLARLAGRSVRSDRTVPGSALFEGLAKFFAILDALPIQETSASSRSDFASVLPT
jgi:flagellar biosynthesis protein FlhF